MEAAVVRPRVSVTTEAATVPVATVSTTAPLATTATTTPVTTAATTVPVTTGATALPAAVAETADVERRLQESSEKIAEIRDILVKAQAKTFFIHESCELINQFRERSRRSQLMFKRPPAISTMFWGRQPPLWKRTND